MYVSIDPGGRTGIAIFTPDGKDHTRQALTSDNFLLYLQSMISMKDQKLITAFIVEDFKLQENKALDLVGHDFIAPQMIGSVRLTAKILNVPIHYTYPRNLDTAFKWAGVKKPKGHPPDEIAAYVHGVYWLVDNKIRKHRILEEA